MKHRVADSAKRHGIKPMDRWVKRDRGREKQRKRTWENWGRKRNRKWGAGKHLGPNEKKSEPNNSETKEVEKRWEGKINACFFTTFPISGMQRTAGYSASKRDNPAVSHPHATRRHLAPNLSRLFLSTYYGSPLFLSVILSTKEMRQHSGITNSSLGRVLRNSLTRQRFTRRDVKHSPRGFYHP